MFPLMETRKLLERLMNKRYIRTKPKPQINSTKGYWKDIFWLQDLHFLLKRKKESRGTLSNQEILFLHEGQYERPLRVKPKGRR